jgi:hypothetical protein
MATELENIDEFNRTIYIYFKNSPKRFMELKVFAKLKKEKIYKILKLYDIRWFVASEFGNFANKR